VQIDLIIFLSNSVFWILFYILQGKHDVHIIEEVKLLRGNLSESQNNEIEKEIIYRELKWKFWGSLEKALVKLVLSTIIYITTNDVYFATLCFLLSVGLRWLIHDLTVAIGLKKGFKHIGPDFIWTDRLLIKLQKIGINQYFVKLSINLLIILLSLIHIID
jgi:hypothetical protein